MSLRSETMSSKNEPMQATRNPIDSSFRPEQASFFPIRSCRELIGGLWLAIVSTENTQAL